MACHQTSKIKIGFNSQKSYNTILDHDTLDLSRVSRFVLNSEQLYCFRLNLFLIGFSKSASSQHALLSAHHNVTITPKCTICIHVLDLSRVSRFGINPQQLYYSRSICSGSPNAPATGRSQCHNKLQICH